MPDKSYIYLTIFGMAIATYVFRELPFLVLGERKLGERVVKWLSYLPVSVMAALLLPEILVNKSQGGVLLDVSETNLYIWAAVASFIVSLYFKNFFLTIVFGIVFLAGLRYFLV